jgi:sugar fermentation stimulation protein A
MSFFQYSLVRPEFSFGTVNGSGKKAVRSRLDFLLEGEGIQKALLEVKSVTLAKGNTGFFPDAPTERGTRHLKELEKALGEGYSSFGVFVAQREDIETIVPNSQTDPVFSQAMKDAQENGVRFLGYRCKVSPSSITLQLKSIPVIPC